MSKNNSNEFGLFPDDPKLNKIKVDHFFKSLTFQVLFDKNFNRDERDILLVIFRKTTHFNKMWDRLSIQEISEISGLYEKKTKDILKRLESKAFIDVIHSKGGRGSSRERFNAYRLGLYLFDDIFKKYNQAKRDHGEWK